MDVIDRERPQANQGLYLQAVDALLAWQRASRPGVLPPYDAALLQRELALFPDWYLARHRGVPVEGTLRETLDKTFATIVERNLAAPSVYVHRDFMPRNLMAPTPAADTQIGVLDFQDAVYGPITYDIASLMRDAFLSWEEDFVLTSPSATGKRRGAPASWTSRTGTATSARSTAAWNGWACSVI